MYRSQANGFGGKSVGKIFSPFCIRILSSGGLPDCAKAYKSRSFRVSALTLDMAGTFNMSAAAEHWKPFTSRQRVVTRRPGFLWYARVTIATVAVTRVRDWRRAARTAVSTVNSERQ